MASKLSLLHQAADDADVLRRLHDLGVAGAASISLIASTEPGLRSAATAALAADDADVLRRLHDLASTVRHRS